jgi:catechol 2,3-dioxygenase-like lactoylglutathione lyase family enzyme
MREHLRRPLVTPTLRGVHHLALCTDDMKATVDFYIDVLGMPLVHTMKVPPGLGTSPGNRGNPPYERVRHFRPFPPQAGGPHRRARWETLRHTVNEHGATGRALILR